MSNHSSWTSITAGKCRLFLGGALHRFHSCRVPVVDGIFNGLEYTYRRTCSFIRPIIGGRWLFRLVIGCYGDREDRMMIPMWLQRCPWQMSRSLQPFPHPCAVDTRTARFPFFFIRGFPFKEQSMPRGTFSFLYVVPLFFSQFCSYTELNLSKFVRHLYQADCRIFFLVFLYFIHFQ